MARKSSAAAASARSSGLPLFFHKPQPLDAVRHAHASVSSGGDFSFASDTNSITLNAVEFIEAVKYYPVVFTGGENPTPVAILGLERGNYFVEADNRWKAGAYIPAYARQYPFIFFEDPRRKKMYLCIDEAAANYYPSQPAGATPLYTVDGKPSNLTKHALQFCTAFYQHYQATRDFCDALKAHKLLIPYQSEATLTSGKKLGLSGFQAIDEKALSKLPEKVFLEFRKKGWLPFIYLALASTSNWKRLADLASEK